MNARRCRPDRRSFATTAVTLSLLLTALAAESATPRLVGDRHVAGELIVVYRTSDGALQAKAAISKLWWSGGTQLPTFPPLSDSRTRCLASHPRNQSQISLVERRRIELPTFALRTRRSPS